MMKSTVRSKQNGTWQRGLTISLRNVVGLSAFMLFVGLRSSAVAAVAVSEQNSSGITSEKQSMRRAKDCSDDCASFATGLPWNDPDPAETQVCQFAQCRQCSECTSGGGTGTGFPTAAPSPALDNGDIDIPTASPSPSPDDDTESPTQSPTPATQDGDNTNVAVTDAPSASPTPDTQDSGNTNVAVTDAPSPFSTPAPQGKCKKTLCNGYNTDQGLPWKHSDLGADPNDPAICEMTKCLGCQQCIDYTETDVPTVSPSISPTLTSAGGDDSGTKCDDECYDYVDDGMVWKDADPNEDEICAMPNCEECQECNEDNGTGVTANTNAPSASPSASPTLPKGESGTEVKCDSQCGAMVSIPWTDPDPTADQICSYSICSECPQCSESGSTETDVPTESPTPTPQTTGGWETETDAPSASPTPAPQTFGGWEMETDYPTRVPTPRPTPPAYYAPTTPTYDESHAYKPPDDDILDENEEGTADQLGGQRPPETPQEMLHDRNVEILAGVIGGVAIVLWLLTAHQVMENPDGLCAGICRLCVKCVCLIFKIVCLPCRFICGCGSKSRRGHVPASTIDDSNMRYDLELA